MKGILCLMKKSEKVFKELMALENDKLEYKKEIVKNLFLATLLESGDFRKPENGSIRALNDLVINYYLELCKEEKIIITTAQYSGDKITRPCTRYSKMDKPFIHVNGILSVDKRLWPDFISDTDINLSRFDLDIDRKKSAKKK